MCWYDQDRYRCGCVFTGLRTLTCQLYKFRRQMNRRNITPCTKHYERVYYSSKCFLCCMIATKREEANLLMEKLYENRPDSSAKDNGFAAERMELKALQILKAEREELRLSRQFVFFEKSRSRRSVKRKVWLHALLHMGMNLGDIRKDAEDMMAELRNNLTMVEDDRPEAETVPPPTVPSYSYANILTTERLQSYSEVEPPNRSDE